MFLFCSRVLAEQSLTARIFPTTERSRDSLSITNFLFDSRPKLRSKRVDLSDLENFLITLLFLLTSSSKVRVECHRLLHRREDESCPLFWFPQILIGGTRE